MIYVVFFIAAILLIILSSIIFKPIGGLAIKFCNYLRNIFLEEEESNGKEA